MKEETMPPTEIILMPRFNYSHEVEVLKRFVEKLGYAPSTFSDPQELADWIGRALPFVRDAVSEVMTDDIERQIKITNEFPIRWPTFAPHEFVPGAPPSLRCANADWPECGAIRNSVAHVLA